MLWKHVVVYRWEALAKRFPSKKCVKEPIRIDNRAHLSSKNATNYSKT